jgi:DNA invertase Pin-like site-specific DNA recombinase
MSDLQALAIEIAQKRRRGRPTNNSSNRIRWQVTFLNPANKLPISIEQFKTVDEIAVRLGISVGNVYMMNREPTKRWEYVKVEKLNKAE